LPPPKCEACNGTGEIKHSCGSYVCTCVKKHKRDKVIVK